MRGGSAADRDDQIEVEGHEVHRTDAGILWHAEEADEDIWFPLAQVEISGDGESLLVPKWLADKKGLG